MVATAEKPQFSKIYGEHREIWGRYVDTLRPPEELTPAEFAVKFRILHEIYCTERPGKWDNDVFPYQPRAMDTIKEAIETGKRGVVFMKAGQIGGTDCMINAMMWLKVYYPGPQLFMTSTDDVAKEFGRERFELILEDMPPLSARRLNGGKTQILVKRFFDGKIVLCGGQSVFKLQSTPYRHVAIDELDSLVEDLGGTGDPLKLAETRTNSFIGETLIVAYAHPTTKERGAGKLYYESSDQRRGFVTHECGGSFYLQWEHVKAAPLAGQTQEEADQDPAAYVYICPQCGAIISDAERVAMTRHMEYRSVLPLEVATKKAWIGIHASLLYSPGKSIRSFAEDWIDCKCGADENKTRVFYNKKLGETYEPKVQKIDVNDLRKLIVVKRRANDPEFYVRGQVPPGVRFLTAGQDTRTTELHHTIWGWGLRRAVDKNLYLCGWLIDWGVIKRQYSLNFSAAEYSVYNDLIYHRRFTSTANPERSFSVRMGVHDIGYAPTQIPIVKYCQQLNGRAVPGRGDSLEASSVSNAPFCRWGAAIKVKAGKDVEAVDATSRSLIMNTYILKVDMFGFMDPKKRITIPDMNGREIIGERSVPRLILPEDVDTEFLQQSRNEELVTGKRTGETMWKKSGPNHYADCNTYAYGAALQIDPFQKNMTDEENQQYVGNGRRMPVSDVQDARDPMMG